MENLQNHEVDRGDIRSEAPLVEVFNNAAKTQEIWKNEELTMQVEQRTRLAGQIARYLEAANPTKEQQTEYFAAGSELLNDPDNRRLALYWPLDDMNEASDEFKQAYLDSWQDMLFSHDMRENFKEGDTYEPEARSTDPERVVKAAHLIPWLLRSGFLSAENLANLLEHSDDITLKRSVRDAIPLMKDWDLIDAETWPKFEHLLSGVPAEDDKKAEPLYVSEARREWLKHKDDPEEVADIETSLSGPFSQNADAFRDDIQQITKLMPKDALVLVGGSRLKGYGSRTSDLDVSIYTQGDAMKLIEKYGAHVMPEDFAVNPELIPRLFNTLWIGQEEAMREGREKLVAPYLRLPESQERDRCLEKIESDLLLYRLLHKGFQRMHEDVSIETQKYATIDGNSAFYDPRYRRLATELFVKYVFMPKLTT